MQHLIFLAQEDHDIASCFPVFSVLRPHLKQEQFLAQVRRQQAQEYQILALQSEGHIKSAAGFRLAEFLAWGKVLYIDDLTTLPDARGQGYASLLLDWLTEYAREKGCDEMHLDTGYTRHAAHRVYLKHGFELKSHHMSKSIIR